LALNLLLAKTNQNKHTNDAANSYLIIFGQQCARANIRSLPQKKKKLEKEKNSTTIKTIFKHKQTAAHSSTSTTCSSYIVSSVQNLLCLFIGVLHIVCDAKKKNI